MSITIDQGLQEAKTQLSRLKELGFDFDAIIEKLQHEGVAFFSDSFEKLKKERIVHRVW